MGAALRWWTAVGDAGAATRPTVRLPWRRKGPRLSLLRVGQWFVPRVARQLHLGVRVIRAQLPPRWRRFPWLLISEAVT